jgi:hypothetical protein
MTENVWIDFFKLQYLNYHNEILRSYSSNTDFKDT